MGADLANHASLAAAEAACRLIVRKDKGLSEILQFVTSGLEIGQLVVMMAGAPCLKDIARHLGEQGLRPDALLHSGRLVFLTAPACFGELFKRGDPLQRGPLRRQSTVIRWISDWSWAFGNGDDPAVIREYQRRIHEFVRPLNALSICTVHCEKLERTTLLAMLVDHRRGSRGVAAASASPAALA